MKNFFPLQAWEDKKILMTSLPGRRKIWWNAILLHIPSDIAIDEKFLSPSSLGRQENLNDISSWTQKNLMKLNPAKCNYMIFSRSKEKFSTRLKIGDSVLERKQTSKILGIQISDDLSWTKNVQEICKKSYSRMTTKTWKNWADYFHQTILTNLKSEILKGFTSTLQQHQFIEKAQFHTAKDFWMTITKPSNIACNSMQLYFTVNDDLALDLSL